MHLEQFFVEGLGHQSYLIGSDTTQEAFVIDPRRDSDIYTRAAREAGLRIRYVLETHNHNDFISGAKELANRHEAAHVASAQAGLHFPFQPVNDGDELQLGELVLRVLETPGHTPEHVSYAVFDTSRSATQPLAVFTGGDLLSGAVGRPDLLGRALGEQLAPQLYDSLHHKLLPLGDGTLVFPTHGTGSLCGRGISATRFSSIGYERLTNPALQQPNKEQFVQYVLTGDPAIPAYYARMRPANQAGPVPFVAPDPKPLSPSDVVHLTGHGAVVLDVRPAVAFGGAHIPGAYHVPMDALLVTWAGWLVPPDMPIVLVMERDSDWPELTATLRRAGFELFAGYLHYGMTLWLEQGLAIESVPQLSPLQSDSERHDAAVQVLDVRTQSEWDEGHIPGAFHLPLGSALPDDLPELHLDTRRPVVVICGSGYRSSIACSLLQQRGFEQVWNALGGMAAWREAGLPVVQ